MEIALLCRKCSCLVICMMLLTFFVQQSTQHGGHHDQGRRMDSRHVQDRELVQYF